MGRKKLSMRKLCEVLRLRFDKDLGYHGIGGSCGISASTARTYARRAEEAGVGWSLPEGITDADLTRRLFPATEDPEPVFLRPLPDFTRIH